VPLGGLAGGGEQDRVAVHPEHLGHLEALGGDRLAVDGQVAGVAEVGGADQGAGPGADGHAGHDRGPGGVVGLGHHLGAAGAGVDRDDPQDGLRAVLQDGEQAVVVPHHAHQVLVLVPAEVDVDAGAGAVDDVQGDLGVRGAGRGVAVLGRRGAGIGRVAQVPDGHRGLVDAGHGQPVAGG
jgi:hypothetical protein